MICTKVVKIKGEIKVIKGEINPIKGETFAVEDLRKAGEEEEDKGKLAAKLENMAEAIFWLGLGCAAFTVGARAFSAPSRNSS